MSGIIHNIRTKFNQEYNSSESFFIDSCKHALIGAVSGALSAALSLSTVSTLASRLLFGASMGATTLPLMRFSHKMFPTKNPIPQTLISYISAVMIGSAVGQSALKFTENRLDYMTALQLGGITAGIGGYLIFAIDEWDKLQYHSSSFS